MKIYKVHCDLCGIVTPQIDNTCSWRCQRCFGANSFSNLQDGEWAGEELKAFYEQYPQDWNMSAPRFPVTIGMDFNQSDASVVWVAAAGDTSGFKTVQCIPLSSECPVCNPILANQKVQYVPPFKCSVCGFERVLAK